MCEVTPKMPDVPEKQLAMMQVLYAEDVLENPRAKLGLADVESVSFDKLASWGVAFDPIVSIAQNHRYWYRQKRYLLCKHTRSGNVPIENRQCLCCFLKRQKWCGWRWTGFNFFAAM